MPRQHGEATLRCHRCLNCRSVFISGQKALTEDEAADILEVVEA